ncbi:MAG: hypothetical protein IV107_24425 [Paucibacter sp.]|nr:hypothetical protein [Roseateles sp.]
MAVFSHELALFPLEREVLAASQLLSERNDWSLRLFVAWGSRQLNSPRALTLATQLLLELAQEQEQTAFMDPAVLASMRGRLHLVQGEVAMLMMRHEQAWDSLAKAGAEFGAYPNPIGLADLHWLSSCIRFDCGEVDLQRDALQSALDCADQANDGERQLFLRANLARSDLFRDFELAQATWSEQLPHSIEGLSPMCAAALADFRALEQGLADNYGEASRWLDWAYESSMETGQVRRAIAAASNQGYTYTSISDFESALRWLKKGLTLARKVQWPGAIGLCLAHTGEALRRVGQTESARELLRECLQTLQRHPHSRAAMMALNYLGQAELDDGHYAEALAHFELLGQRENLAHAPDMHSDVVLGRARALMHLKRLDEARTLALDAATAMAGQQQKVMLVELRQLLAEIERRGGGTPDMVLAWLNQALELAEAVAGYQTPASLLDAAADMLSQAGRFEQAYAMAQRAMAARQTAWNTSSKHSRQQAEVARNERQLARRLAQTNEERLLKLQGAHDQLQQLVIAGREIWRQPSPGLVFSALSRALKSLLDLEVLAIYRPRPGGQQLAMAESARGEHEGLAFEIAADALDGACASCWRDWVERSEPRDGQVLRMFTPMIGDDGNLGVLVLERAASAVWGQREQAALRHLSTDAAMSIQRALGT